MVSQNIISAHGNAPLGVVLEAGDGYTRMITFLYGRYASNVTVTRIAVQSQWFYAVHCTNNVDVYRPVYLSFRTARKNGT